MRKILFILFFAMLFASRANAVELKIPSEGQNDLRIENAEINDTVFSFGNNVTVDGIINGDLYVFGNNIFVNGVINGNVFALGSQITVNAEISKDLVTLAQDFSLTEKSIIKRNLYGRSNHVNIPTGTQIEGKNKIVEFENKFDFRTTLPGLLSLIFTALVLGRIFPNVNRDLIEINRKNWGKSLLYGVLAYILTIVVAGLLLISLIGAPLALIILGLFVLCLYLANITSGLIIGNYLFKDKVNKYLALILGLIIVKYIKYIPEIGPPLFILIYLFGFGSIVLTKIKYFDKINK